jgi:hypothetical protein
MWGNANRELTLKEKIAIQKLRDNNIASLVVSYSGGGDDGCIDDITCNDHNDKAVDYNDPKSGLLNSLEDYLYELLSEEIEWDWINNDGGWGSLTINLDTGESVIDHTQRVSEEHTYQLNNDHKLVELLNGAS